MGMADYSFNAGQNPDAKKERSEEKKEAPIEDTTKYKWWMLLPIALILGGIVLSSSASLDVIEKGFTEQIRRALAGQALQDVHSRFPHLTSQELETISKKELEKELENPETKKAINQLVEKQKNFFRDENGNPYLLETDAYYYLRYADNILNNGHPGETLKNGKPFDTLRIAPYGIGSGKTLLPIAEAAWFKIWRILSPEVMLLRTSFYLPVALGIVSITLIFFIGLKIFKDAKAAFFSSILFAAHPFFFRQNMAGFTDTTILIMPVSLAFFYSIFWLIEGKKWQRMLAGILSPLILLTLKKTWSGWFFVLGVLAAFCIAFSVYTLLKRGMKKKEWIITVIMGTAGAGLAWLMYYVGYVNSILIKMQLAGGLSGTFRTVRELANQTFPEFIKTLGGTLFSILLLISIMWILYKIVRRRATTFELFLLTWFIVLFLPSLRPIRYLLFAVPPATLMVGWLMQRMHKALTEYMASLQVMPIKISSIILLIILPLSVGATMVNTISSTLAPMSDATVETADWLKLNTEENAIINTWWDNGYVWQYAARRPTVLDAGPDRAVQYMARALMSDNETHALSIMRMLDCGNLKAYDSYKDSFGLPGISALEDILKKPKKQAEQTLSKAPELINLTHCAPPDAYVIAENNMMQVIASIDALSLWDAELELINEKTAGMPEDEAIEYIQDQLNISQKEARKKYVNSGNQNIVFPDRAISTVDTCSEITLTTIECFEFTVDLANITATRSGNYPYSLSLFENGTRKEKVFPEAKSKLSLVVYKEEEFYRAMIMSQEYRNTMLVRLFVEDNFDNLEIVHRAFEPYRIVTWKINWNTKGPDKQQQSYQAST